MFQKILVPVDLSEKNRKTVAAARDLCQGAELTLLHVIETIDDVPFEELESFYRRIEEKANHELAALAEQARQQADRMGNGENRRDLGEQSNLGRCLGLRRIRRTGGDLGAYVLRRDAERVAAGWVTDDYVYPSYRALWKDLSSRPE